jgi:hypothetical protein
MPSESAKAVAQEVIATVRNGKIPNKQVIQQKHGYSKSSARAMKATRTKAYQEEIQPIVDVMIAERDAALEEAKKKRGKANYRDLVDASAKLTKDIQLLSGGKTANEELKITWGE